MTEANGSVRFINPSTLSTPTGYSHVVEINNGRTVYIAGQIALDPAGQLVGQGDLRAQTVQIFENLKAALASVGASFENVIKSNFYMLDVSQIAVVREVRNQYITSHQPPVSTVVEVRRLVHPDWLIEVEVVAFLPAGK